MQNEIQEFLTLLKELQKIDSEFPIQYAICLAEISLNEGLSVTDLANHTGLALPTVSRIVGALSQYRQTGRPYELVELKTAPHSRRTKQITLSEKGRKVVNDIAELMTA